MGSSKRGRLAFILFWLRRRTSVPEPELAVVLALCLQGSVSTRMSGGGPDRRLSMSVQALHMATKRTWDSDRRVIAIRQPSSDTCPDSGRKGVMLGRAAAAGCLGPYCEPIPQPNWVSMSAHQVACLFAPLPHSRRPEIIRSRTPRRQVQQIDNANRLTLPDATLT